MQAGTLYVEGLKYRVARPSAAVTDSLPGPAPRARATHTDYEFVPVTDTQHHDDYLQGQLGTHSFQHMLLCTCILDLQFLKLKCPLIDL